MNPLSSCCNYRVALSTVIDRDCERERADNLEARLVGGNDSMRAALPALNEVEAYQRQILILLWS